MSIAPTTLKNSLKRLYAQGKISENELLEMINATPPKLDDEDYLYITCKPLPTK